MIQSHTYTLTIHLHALSTYKLIYSTHTYLRNMNEWQTLQFEKIKINLRRHHFLVLMPRVDHRRRDFAFDLRVAVC